MSLDKYLSETPIVDKYLVLEEPDKKLVAELIRTKWKSYVILIFAFSRVDYTGRATSKLEWNDHLIIIKPDGTLLIHGETKREPINWQPPGSVITSYIENDNLVIRSRRYRPKEIVIITIREVYLFIAILMKSGKFKLLGTEAELVDYVFSHPQMLEEGFKPIAKEYRGRYGIIDLLGRDKNGNLVVCEFKRRTADVQDVAQLALYVDSLRKDLGENVRGILLAPAITNLALIALKEKNLEFRKISLGLLGVDK